MEETIISIDTAKLAKEKGFKYNPLEDRLSYTENGILYEMENDLYTGSDIREKYHIAAPTQSLLQKYLREVHNIHIEPKYDYLKKCFNYTIITKSENTRFCNSKTYEKALEIGLQEALKLI